MDPGRTLCERYVLERELGRGGMGVVFAGRDHLLEREVAIKLIGEHGDRDLLELGLRREAKLVASLDHPGVVPVYDFGRDDDLLFLVMPLVQGRSLRELLEAGPLPIALLAEIGRQAAAALAYSHAAGVIHRDVKPGNLMLVSDASGVSVRLMDFGLAQIASEAAAPDKATPWQSSSQHGAATANSARLVGTPPYLAPEQARGEAADARSDLYALGAVLYECAVGRPPFTGDLDALLEAIQTEPPVRPGLLRAELPIELDALIVALLAKQPAQRPTDAHELAERLELHADATGAVNLLASPHAVGPSLGSGLGSGPITLDPNDSRTALLHDAVGRDRILRTIDLRLTAARAGALQLILLAGEAGIGKTTVLDELALACQQREIELLRTSATPDKLGSWRDQRGNWLGPFGELLTAGLAQRPEAVELLAPYAAQLVALFPNLARSRLGRHAHEPRREPSWAGLEPGNGGGARLVSSALTTRARATRSQAVRSRTERTQDLLVRAFNALVADGRPLTLAIDDAHLSGETVKRVELLFRRLPRAPLVFILAHERSQLRADHPLARLSLRLADHPRALALELGPLDEEVHDALMIQLLGGGQLKPGLAARLFHESGGLPLYARELVRAAVEGSFLVQRDGVWRLDAPRWPIPRQLRAVIEAQLRRLPSGALAALRIGSVLASDDGSFELHELVELQGRSRAELEHLLDRALERGLISETRGDDRITLRFNSELLRRIVHAGLSSSARRKLHMHRAQRLRRLPFSEPDAEQREQAILTHLIAGQALVDARPLVVGLVHEALDEGRPERALTPLTSLIEVAEALGPHDRAELQLLLAELELARNETQPAIAALGRLAAALDHSDDARLARLGERGAELARQLDRRELADRLLGLRPRDRRAAERQRRARAELAALRPATSSRSMQIGDLLLMHGEYTAAREAYDTARRRAAADGDHDEEARQLQRLARVSSRLGHYETAIGYCREGLEQLAGRRSLERVGLWALAAFAHVVAGYHDRAAAELEAAAADLATFPDSRDPDHDRVAAELERSRGNYFMATGDANAAIEAYERCLAFNPGNDRWTLSVARFNLGQACALAGHANRALRELERSAADKRAIGDREGLAYAQLARVEVLRDLGHIEDAGETLVEARELADEIEDPRLFAQVHVEFGRNALLTGKLELATQEARRAKDMAKGVAAGAELGSAYELLAAIDLARGDHSEACRHAELAIKTAQSHKLDGLRIGALLILAEASAPDRRPELLDQARSAGESFANPYRELDVSLTSLRLGLGDPNHAGDDYVALEQLSDRAEGLTAQRHVGLCLIAQAEVLAPHDPRGALDHARLGEAQLRVLGAKLEADRAGELIARLTLR